MSPRLPPVRPCPVDAPRLTATPPPAPAPVATTQGALTGAESCTEWLHAPAGGGVPSFEDCALPPGADRTLVLPCVDPRDDLPANLGTFATERAPTPPPAPATPSPSNPPTLVAVTATSDVVLPEITTDGPALTSERPITAATAVAPDGAGARNLGSLTFDDAAPTSLPTSARKRTVWPLATAGVVAAAAIALWLLGGAGDARPPGLARSAPTSSAAPVPASAPIPAAPAPVAAVPEAASAVKPVRAAEAGPQEQSPSVAANEPVAAPAPSPPPDVRAQAAKRPAARPQAVKSTQPKVALASPATPANGLPLLAGPELLEVTYALGTMRAPPAASREGILAISAEPPGEVVVNGRRVGMSPVEIRLRAKTYDVMVRNAEFGARARTIAVEAGSRRNWHCQFAEP